MAIQHNIILDSGIELPTAYSKIISYQGTSEELRYTVETHAFYQARLDRKQPIRSSDSFIIKLASLEYDPSINVFVNAFITALYNNLKIQDGYNNGIDV